MKAIGTEANKSVPSLESLFGWASFRIDNKKTTFINSYKGDEIVANKDLLRPERAQQIKDRLKIFFISFTVAFFYLKIYVLFASRV